MHFKLNLLLFQTILFSFYSRRASDLSTWPRWRLTTRRPTEPTWRRCAARCPICWAWSCPRRSQTSWKRARKGSKNPKPKFWVSFFYFISCLVSDFGEFWFSVGSFEWAFLSLRIEKHPLIHFQLKYVFK